MYRLVFLTLFAGALADLKLPGRCDFASLKYKSIDDISVFAGQKWFVAASLGNDWNGGDCPTVVTNKHPDTPKTELLSDWLFTKNGKSFKVNRPIKCENNALKQYLNPYSEQESQTVDYYLLDTDLKTYALIYTCIQESSDSRIVSALVYSSEKFLSSEAVAKLDISTQLYPELKQAPWKVYDHKNCPF